jgi:hypothetical protein
MLKLKHKHKNSKQQNKNKIALGINKNLNSQSIWQINLHKCSEANSLLVNDALNEAKRPIVLITEPFCNKNKKVEFTTKGYTLFSVTTPAIHHWNFHGYCWCIF